MTTSTRPDAVIGTRTGKVRHLRADADFNYTMCGRWIKGALIVSLPANCQKCIDYRDFEAAKHDHVLSLRRYGGSGNRTDATCSCGTWKDFSNEVGSGQEMVAEHRTHVLRTVRA